MAFIPVADAIAALRAAGHCVTRTTRADAARRYGCQTALYVVDGRGVNLGRLRELATLAQAEPAPVAEPAPAPVAEPAAPEPVAPAPLSPAGVVALLCRKFPVSTPATYHPAVARLQARGAAVNPVSVLRELNRPVLPGELTPPPAPTPHGAAAPELPTLRAARTAQDLQAAAPPAGAGVAAHRAAAAAGRPVSLAALAHDLAHDLGRSLAQDGRLPSRAQAPARPAPSGEGLAGQPWDPGTPAARAAVALQGERVGILWPIAQALRGEGVALPPSWASDGPVMAGELTLSDALARLPLGAIAQAAAALAALPPVTGDQAAALSLCRTGCPGPRRPAAL